MSPVNKSATPSHVAMSWAQRLQRVFGPELAPLAARTPPRQTALL
jgi:hypothetical protein